MGRGWTPMPFPGFFMVFEVSRGWSRSLQIPYLVEAAPIPIV